jgi:glyoxylase-like metal-dependent hydrolase (beta-lactamase superfamily II)
MSNALPVGPRALTDPFERHGRKWRIGAVTITKIVEHEVVGELELQLPAASRERLLALPWLQPHFLTSEGLGISSIHALVIETPDRCIVVDTCGGNDKDREALVPMFHRLQGPFLQDFASAGFARDRVDTVLCTHLHFDHIGWNTIRVDDRWVPTFPNARYLVSDVEYRHWSQALSSSMPAWDTVQRAAFVDSVEPVLAAGQLDRVDEHHVLCPEVRLLPTPGHSPGHVSVWISSRGEHGVITGDVAHHPCQLAHLDWGSAFDFDATAAARTRARLFSQCADQPVLVIGTHWAGATAGRIVRDGDAYRLSV